MSHRALNGEQFAEQQRLFDVKGIPTKKDYPQPGARPNPNFDQPMGGSTIGKYLYHHSPSRNRASIRRQGLQVKDPLRRSAKGVETRATAPEGVYMGPYGEVNPARPAAGLYARQSQGAHDIWAIDTNKIRTNPDPSDTENYYGFHYSDYDVPPDAMKLIHKGFRK
jgi:hypothetical protein